MIEPPLQTRRDLAVPFAGPSSVRGHATLTIFQVSGELLAVDAGAVQEIALMAELSVPRGLPTAIAGFLNLGHRPVPIIRLARLLSLPDPALGLYTQILIVRDGGRSPIGWIVERVTQIIHVRHDDVLAVPENHCFRDCAKGMVAR